MNVQINLNVENLTMLWVTEVNTPDILPYNGDIVNRVKDNMLRQQEVIDDLFATDDSEQHFLASLYQMEVDRIRYGLSRYLRTRLMKIEGMIDIILADENLSEFLSDDEHMFASKLRQLNMDMIESAVLSKFNSENRRMLSKWFVQTSPNVDDVSCYFGFNCIVLSSLVPIVFRTMCYAYFEKLLEQTKRSIRRIPL